MSDPKIQARVAERLRQVRSRIDRAKNVVAQWESGALRIPTDEQKKQIEQYPQWLEDLEELKQGRLPQTRPAASTEAAQPTAESTRPAEGTANSNGKKNGKKAKEAESGADEAPEEAEDGEPAGAAADADEGSTDITSQEDLLSTLVALRGAEEARDELLDMYIERYMQSYCPEQAECDEAEKKLESANDIKKKIISGAIKKPSKVQLTQIEQLPNLRKNATNARKKAKRAEQKLREDLLQKLEALIAAAPPLEEEEDKDEEDAEDEKETKKEEEKEEAPEEAADETQEADNVGTAEEADTTTTAAAVAVADEAPLEPTPPAPAEEVDHSKPTAKKPEEEEEEKKPKAENGDTDATPAPQPAEEPAHDEEPVAEASAKDDAEADDNGDETAAADAEEGEKAEGEEEAMAAAAGIDWSKLKYSKNSRSFTLRSFTAVLREPAGGKPTEAVKAATSAAAAATAPEAAATAKAPESVLSAVEEPTLHYVRRQLCFSGGDGAEGGEARGNGGPAASSSLPAGVDSEAGGCAERVAREWALLQERPIPRVAVYHATQRDANTPSGSVQWHVDVSPVDGPLAGQPVHLTLTFPPSYPFAPPQVHSPVALPHRAMMVSNAGQDNALFLTYQPSKPTGSTPSSPTRGVAGWSADMDVTVVLMELQTIFDADSFSAPRRALGDALFEEKMSEARVAMGRYHDACSRCTMTAEEEEDRQVLTGATLFNGPFLTATASLTGEASPEPEAEDDAEGGRDTSEARAEGGDDRQAAPAASPIVYDDRAARADGVIVGPYTGCWGHLLCAQRSTGEAAGKALYVHLRAGQPVDAAATNAPTLSVVSVPASVIEVGRGGGNGRRRRASARRSWASRVLREAQGAASQGGGSTSSGVIWSLPASVWASSAKTSRAVVAIQCDEASASGDATATAVLPRPTSTAEEDHAAFALSLTVPAGQSVSVAFSNSPSSPFEVEAATSAKKETSALASFLQLWPAAQRVLQGSTPSAAPAAAAGGKKKGGAASDESGGVSGMLMEVPMGFAELASGDSAGVELTMSGVAGSPDSTFYIPRRVGFHLVGGAIPAVLSESAFRHYRAMLQRRPPVKDGQPSDHYLAVVPEEIVRRVLNVANGGGGAAAGGGRGRGAGEGRGGSGRGRGRGGPNAAGAAGSPTASSGKSVNVSAELFWGQRALFVPFVSAKTRAALRVAKGKSGAVAPRLNPEERLALDRLKRTSVQLYRHPSASVRYTPPFNPLQALHLLSLVMEAIADASTQLHAGGKSSDSTQPAAAARSEAEVEQEKAFLKALAGEMTTTAALLALEEASFAATCTRVVERIAAQSEADASTEPLLFQCSPFLPLRVVKSNDGEAAGRSASSSPSHTSQTGDAAVRTRALKELSMDMSETKEEAAWYETRLQTAALLLAADCVVALGAGDAGVQSTAKSLLAGELTPASVASSAKSKKFLSTCRDLLRA